jgi:hypothetical protein
MTDTKTTEQQELKNFRAIGVKLDVEDAKSLRDLCEKTGLPVTYVVKRAIHLYLPYMWKQTEGLMEEANVR